MPDGYVPTQYHVWTFTRWGLLMAYSIFRRGTVLKGLLRKYISPGLFFLKRYILIAVNSSSRLLKFFNFFLLIDLLTILPPSWSHARQTWGWWGPVVAVWRPLRLSWQHLLPCSGGEREQIWTHLAVVLTLKLDGSRPSMQQSSPKNKRSSRVQNKAKQSLGVKGIAYSKRLWSFLLLMKSRLQNLLGACLFPNIFNFAWQWRILKKIHGFCLILKSKMTTLL